MGCTSSKSSSAATVAVGKGELSPAATSSSSPRGVASEVADPSITQVLPPRPPPWDHPATDASSVHSTHSDATNGIIGGCTSGDGSEGSSSLPSVMSAPDLQQLKNNKTRNLNSQHRKTGSKLGLTDDLKCGERKNPNLVRIEVPLGKGIEEVYQGVHDGTVLGSGVSGIVRRVTHRETSVEYAVKCLDLALIDSDAGLRQLKEEIYIMCQLDHPNIVRLEEVYESHSEIYLVQEVCKGGELFDRLDEQPDYHYNEAQCARLVKQMLSSVIYLHNKGIIHRDLKLENFLFRDNAADSELVMIDFGLSKHFTFGEVHSEAVGTPYTVAPEVIKGRYDERCDVWAIGVITYLLLSGEPPFGGCGGPETLLQVRDNILRGSFKFEPKEVWRPVSKEAKNFIKSLLVVDPLKRPTAQQAKESKWLKMCSSVHNTATGGEDSTINPNVVKALVGFREYSDMRKLLCEVLSFTLLPEQIQGLRKEFEKYDKEGTGEISLTTLKTVLIGNASTGKLGGLTEAEVEDIFHAMRVRKDETTIHWHDFIAAGLSQCAVDDRNLRLAFGRLDQKGNGYISFENVLDLLGADTFGNEDQMLQMWGGETSMISYDDFVLIMKGQALTKSGRFDIQQAPSFPLPEILEDEEESTPYNSSSALDQILNETPSPTNLPTESTIKNSLATIGLGNSFSAPATPLHVGKRFGEVTESPLGMEDDDGRIAAFNEQLINRLSSNFPMPTVGTPPLTPLLETNVNPAPLSGISGIGAFHSSLAQDTNIKYNTTTTSSHPSLERKRSVSLDEDLKAKSESDIFVTAGIGRVSPAFHEHSTTSSSVLESVLHVDGKAYDETKTPLVINRNLYRAHRNFRHTLTEACKRFEDEQIRRAKETLRAQESAAGAKHTAGLVMRHGAALDMASVKKFLTVSQEEQQKLVDQANRRGGRGRHVPRKKTTSDMSGMLGGVIVTPPPSPDMVGGDRKKLATPETLSPIGEDEDIVLRRPTLGEFRTSNYDPFQIVTTMYAQSSQIKADALQSVTELDNDEVLSN